MTNFRLTPAAATSGTFDVTFANRLALRRCIISPKRGRFCVSPPLKHVIGRDGTVQRTADGKARYEQTAFFADRATQERWSAAVMRALRIAALEALA